MNRAHLCIVSPPGHVHALGLLDPARYLRYQLRRNGIEVTLGRNRLRRDAVNLVFGAHLGFDRAWLSEFACVLVNLEQLGEGGASLPPAYLELLAAAPVVDYHPDNCAVYGRSAADVPMLTIGYAPYLDPAVDPTLDPALDTGTGGDRGPDVLFFGSITPRRRQVLAAVQACGVSLTVLDRPLYGPERDRLIRSARCVLNVASYDAARFEQVRASIVLSCGTPLVTERRPGPVPEPYPDSVILFDPAAPAGVLGDRLTGPDFAQTAEQALARFRRHDGRSEVGRLWQALSDLRPGPAAPPRLLNLDALRTGYRPGWLNGPGVGPADFSAGESSGRLPGPRTSTQRWGRLEVAGSLRCVHLGRVDVSQDTTAALLAEAGALLAPGGVVVLEASAAQGPTEWLAMLARAHLLGRPEWRWELEHEGGLDAEGFPCPDDQAVSTRTVLRQVPATGTQAAQVRAGRDDFCVPDDLAVPTPALPAPRTVGV